MRMMCRLSVLTMRDGVDFGSRVEGVLSDPCEFEPKPKIILTTFHKPDLLSALEYFSASSTLFA